MTGEKISLAEPLSPERLAEFCLGVGGGRKPQVTQKRGYWKYSAYYKTEKAFSQLGGILRENRGYALKLIEAIRYARKNDPHLTPTEALLRGFGAWDSGELAEEDRNKLIKSVRLPQHTTEKQFTEAWKHIVELCRENRLRQVVYVGYAADCSKAIQEISKMLADAGLETKVEAADVASGGRLPFDDESVDLVSSFNVLPYGSDKKKGELVSDVMRMLRTDGFLVTDAGGLYRSGEHRVFRKIGEHLAEVDARKNTRLKAAKAKATEKVVDITPIEAKLRRYGVVLHEILEKHGVLAMVAEMGLSEAAKDERFAAAFDAAQNEDGFIESAIGFDGWLIQLSDYELGGFGRNPEIEQQRRESFGRAEKLRSVRRLTPLDLTKAYVDAVLLYGRRKDSEKAPERSALARMLKVSPAEEKHLSDGFRKMAKARGEDVDDPRMSAEKKLHLLAEWFNAKSGEARFRWKLPAYCAKNLLETKEGSSLAFSTLYKIIAEELHVPVYLMASYHRVMAGAEVGGRRLLIDPVHGRIVEEPKAEGELRYEGLVRVDDEFVAYSTLLRYYYGKGYFEKGVELIEKIPGKFLEDKKENLLLAYSLGDFYYEAAKKKDDAGLYEKAAEYYDAVLGYVPDAAWVWKKNGGVLEALGRHDEAHAANTRVFLAEGGRWLKLALQELREGEVRKAEKTVEKLLEEFDDGIRYAKEYGTKKTLAKAYASKAEALLSLGLVQGYRRKEETVKKALGEYDNAILADRGVGSVGKGNALLRLGRPDEALGYFNKAMR